jgi:HlyD family secretion protein
MNNTTSTLLLAVAIAGFIAWVVTGPIENVRAQSAAVNASLQTTEAGAKAAKPQWVASAPGRVEPREGEIRIVSLVPGRIAGVVVGVNDTVRAGDLLISLESEDAEARVAATEAEVAVRTRERDQENVGKLAKDRRTAEDAVARSERALFAARLDLDRLTTGFRKGTVQLAEVDKAHEALKAAVAVLDRERAAARRVAATKDMPLPTRLESGLTVARSELSLSEVALNRTRIRAPADGVVLAVNAKVGELAGPASELPLVMIGDLSKMRVRAEFDERDIEKVRVGQSAVVSSDAFPGRQFEAKVSQVAKSLGAPRVSAKGPRRPNDVDVLEVFVEIEGATPLLSGMRADVFLKAEADAKSN